MEPKPPYYVRIQLKSDELTALLHAICSYDSTKLRGLRIIHSDFPIVSPLFSSSSGHTEHLGREPMATQIARYPEYENVPD